MVRVEASIDGTPIGTSTLAPYVFRAQDGLLEGEHTIFAKAYDTDGLTDTTTRTVTLKAPIPIFHFDASVPTAAKRSTPASSPTREPLRHRTAARA